MNLSACLLVYEHMPNKSLDLFLFPDTPNVAVPLSWRTRLLIMIGVARGLTYLHSANVIYRDVKSANILLDGDFNAKLADFGLARRGPETEGTHVSTCVVGTYGYAAPEYVQTGRLNIKSDVYGFGVVMLCWCTCVCTLSVIGHVINDVLVSHVS
ncbi:putative protein kinase RLK-Pelle-RLCK-VIIa-2 family [Helianthus annuus]|nr:putative protein kinase RLK-Pelle-RLCK-VIIa-2 family [Helianthus annuus]